MTQELKSWKELLAGDPILALTMYERSGLSFKKAWRLFVKNIVYSSRAICMADSLCEHVAEWGDSDYFIMHNLGGLYVALDLGENEVILGLRKDCINIPLTDPYWNGGNIIEVLRRTLYNAANWMHIKLFDTKMATARRKRPIIKTQTKLDLR